MKADPEMELFIERRNDHVHDSGLQIVSATLEEVSHFRFSDDPGVRDWLVRRRRRQGKRQERVAGRSTSQTFTPEQPLPRQYEPRWFITGMTDRDAFTVCVQHYEKVRKAVEALRGEALLIRLSPPLIHCVSAPLRFAGALRP